MTGTADILTGLLTVSAARTNTQQRCGLERRAQVDGRQQRVTRWVVRQHRRPLAEIIARSTTHRPTVCACALQASGPNDNYSRVISHFICKIASADRPGAAINFPPLKLFRLDGKDHDAVGRPPGESERARENDIVWMNGAIAAAAQS